MQCAPSNEDVAQAVVIADFGMLVIEEEMSVSKDLRGGGQSFWQYVPTCAGLFLPDHGRQRQHLPILVEIV